ncbi:MAG: flagellar basal-body MS-ring/collar protein FliF [Steroidobacteraceae bacterium]|nr:flagellar M-ring protein FliF [Nevskiaceae bacterium]MCP5339083.1 flagellar M-ring protein FliF [Nevskiaceae bacterium]MCP5359992.1 flagellar M-ring protein FliF [Nevskiaceae bacterium]MCP5472188.1 flagellar M-ring protein FliF [Nevskiaceae bacterium]
MAEAATAPGFLKLTAGLRPLLLLVGIAAAVAAGVGVVLWAQGPTYNLLYGDLASEDAAAVTQALTGAGIAYRLENGTGAISVPAEKLNDARLLLAGQGLSGQGGFASMAKDPGFGVSQFMEGARYQHALESELARTIASLQQVGAARVHIASPRNSSFVRDRVPASASVFIQLRPGRTLATEQVTAIVNLVASSVPELDAARVTVVDQKGRLLSSPQGRDDVAIRDQQMEFARQLEESYAQRIEGLLAPLVGTGRVRAQVNAQIDLSATEEAREQYRPDSQIVRSEQLSEESSHTGGGAGGIPGTFSNQPPPAGVALPPGVQPAKTAENGAVVAADGSSSKQATRNYEIDRTVAYTRQPAGKLQRLSVAVLIDNLRIVDKDGKITETPLPPEQLDRITALVKDAVGFNEQRGDSVNVVNSPWRGEPLPDADSLVSVPFWERPWARDLAKILAGLIVTLVLVFSVLKPLLRQLAGTPRVAAALTSGTAAAALTAPANEPVRSADNPATAGTSTEGSAAAAQASSNSLAYEQQLAQARTVVAQDPARVAQVVKSWVQDDD